MTEYTREGLIRGTLADHVALMSHPLGLRRGNYELRPLGNPAAAANLAYPIGATYFERVMALLFTFATSAVAGSRSLLIAYLNGDGTLFNQLPASPLIGPSESWVVSADLDGTPAGGTGASVNGTGTATAPGAGATIASITLPAGAFTVQWSLGLSGTPGAADADNLALFVGAVQVATSENGGAAGNWPQPAVQIEVPSAGTVVALKAIGAGVAGSVYTAALSAQFSTILTSYPQLPDLLLKSGWQVQAQIIGAQAGDQISGAIALTERYSSEYASGTLAADLEDMLEHVPAG